MDPRGNPSSIPDEVFLALARHAAVPSAAVLAEYQAMQRDRAQRGKAIGLFQLLCDNGALTIEQEKEFRTLASAAASLASRPPQERSADAPLINSLLDEKELAAQLADEERECPRCAERIKVKAKACRFCGHELMKSSGNHAPLGRRLGARSSGRLRAQPGTRDPEAGAPSLKRRLGPAKLTALLIAGFTVVAVVGALVFVQQRPTGAASDASSPDNSVPVEPPRPLPRVRDDETSAEKARRAALTREHEREEADRVEGLDKALKAARAEEAAGETERALAELLNAEAYGATATQLEGARGRLNARLADEHCVRDGIAEVEELLAAEEFEKALSTLETLRPVAARLGRERSTTDLASKVTTARKERDALAQADVALVQALEAIEKGDFDPAQAFIDRARGLAPSTARLDRVARRLEKCKAAPKGLVFVVIDQTAVTGVYARRKPVSNAEYKAWLDGLPVGKRRSAPWVTGDVPAGQEDSPVVRIRPADAEAFAASRSERLPNATERSAIRAVLGAPAHEGDTDKTGFMLNGFRTVQGPETGGGEAPPPDKVGSETTPADESTLNWDDVNDQVEALRRDSRLTDLQQKKALEKLYAQFQGKTCRVLGTLADVHANYDDSVLLVMTTRGGRTFSVTGSKEDAKRFESLLKGSRVSAVGPLAFSQGWLTFKWAKVVIPSDSEPAGANDPAGGDAGRSPKADVANAARARAQNALVARVRGWLLARKTLKCVSCSGSQVLKCAPCRGTGEITVVTFGGEAGGGSARCQTCGGIGKRRCSTCKDGLSPLEVERVRTQYGYCGSLLVEVVDKTVVAELSDDLKTARVRVEVRYGTGSRKTESSVWELDAAGRWRTSGPREDQFGQPR